MLEQIAQQAYQISEIANKSTINETSTLGDVLNAILFIAITAAGSYYLAKIPYLLEGYETKKPHSEKKYFSKMTRLLEKMVSKGPLRKKIFFMQQKRLLREAKKSSKDAYK